MSRYSISSSCSFATTWDSLKLRSRFNTISVGAMLVGILIAMAAGAALVMTLKGPIGQITSAMRRLAEGKLDTSISGEKRRDEIGDMARALSVFKGNAIAKVEMEAKKAAGYFTPDAPPTKADLKKVVGRDLEEF